VQSTAVVQGSIILPSFVSGGRFNFDLLGTVVSKVVRNLNLVVDAASVPDYKSQFTLTSCRPIAIGVQGLADVYAVLKMPYNSEHAGNLSRGIAETIYFNSLKESSNLSRAQGPCSSFERSPVNYFVSTAAPSALDWDTLHTDIELNGLANTFMTAVIAEDSTTDITGCSSGVQPVLR
jgi:ribonucleotide reductase alpha subunit